MYDTIYITAKVCYVIRIWYLQVFDMISGASCGGLLSFTMVGGDKGDSGKR